MADAVSDIVTLTQAASGLIGSLSRLQDTRIQLESARISSEVGRLNSEFLQDMNRSLDDPKRISVQNWRERLDQHKARVQERIDTVSSPVIRTTVDARNAEMSRGFMDAIAAKMMDQEIQVAQDDFGVEMLNTASDSTMSLSDRTSIISRRFAEEQARGLMSGPQFRELRAKTLSPLIAESLADEAVSSLDALVKSRDEDAVASYDDAALAIEPRPGVSEAERQMAIQLLSSRQKQVDAGVEAAWKSVFEGPAKTESVNIAEAESVIDTPRVSAEVKRKMARALEGYSFDMGEKNIERRFNVFRELPMEIKASPEIQAKARELLGSYDQTQYADMTGRLYKEVDGWKLDQGERALEAAKKKAAILGELERYEARKGDYAKDGAFRLYSYIGQYRNDPEIAPFVYDQLKELRDGLTGIDKTVVDALDNDLIRDVIRSAAKDPTTKLSPEAKSMISGMDKTGKDKDYNAQARAAQIEYDVASALRLYIQNSSSQKFDEKANQFLKDEVRKRLTTVAFAGAVPKKGLFEDIPENDVAKYAYEALRSGGAHFNGAPVKDTERYYQQYVEVAGQMAVKAIGEDWGDQYYPSDNVPGRKPGEISFLDKRNKNARIDVVSDGKSIMLYDMTRQGDKWVFVRVRNPDESKNENRGPVLMDEKSKEAAYEAYKSGRGVRP